MTDGAENAVKCNSSEIHANLADPRTTLTPLPYSESDLLRPKSFGRLFAFRLNCAMGSLSVPARLFAALDLSLPMQRICLAASILPQLLRSAYVLPGSNRLSRTFRTISYAVPYELSEGHTCPRITFRA